MQAGDAVLATWAIALVATSGVVVRPWALPEAIWAVLGALAVVLLGLFPAAAALAAVVKGWEVYLFLVGMMLAAELAREEGVFEWLAAHAARAANGSATRLFALVYAVGLLVTVLLSNDATAVVLTPAVYAAARAARAEPLPYLLICAFVANAASFVLPISNPANLVIFQTGMPPLGDWLARFAVPSLLAVAATYAALFWTQRALLEAPLARDVAVPQLSRGGRIVASGLALMAVVLIAASALGVGLGLPTLVSGLAVVALLGASRRALPWRPFAHLSWSVLPLVAGLFVLVEAVQATGRLDALKSALARLAETSPALAAWVAGLGSALLSNLMNNLPVGLLAGSVAESAGLPGLVRGALLIGVDLGPNLSVTGSLATILWLTALRRDGVHVGAWRFLRLGVVVMTPALLLSLAALVVVGR